MQVEPRFAQWIWAWDWGFPPNDRSKQTANSPSSAKSKRVVRQNKTKKYCLDVSSTNRPYFLKIVKIYLPYQRIPIIIFCSVRSVCSSLHTFFELYTINMDKEINRDFVEREFSSISNMYNLGIELLKEEQIDVMLSILKNKDTIGILPTATY